MLTRMRRSGESSWCSEWHLAGEIQRPGERHRHANAFQECKCIQIQTNCSAIVAEDRPERRPKDHIFLFAAGCLCVACCRQRIAHLASQHWLNCRMSNMTACMQRWPIKTYTCLDVQHNSQSDPRSWQRAQPSTRAVIACQWQWLHRMQPGPVRPV